MKFLCFYCREKSEAIDALLDKELITKLNAAKVTSFA